MVIPTHIRLVLGLLSILSVGVGVVVNAQRPSHWAPEIPGRWVYLGQANVDRRVDRDSIYVGRDRGRFQRIQIRVDRAPIEFHRVVVHYANGRREEVDVRRRIPPGGQTRAIDLRGDERAINSVEFVYGKGRWGYGREPRVRLYGI
ncbi:MAG: hypothetical protein ACREA2_13300 [Blastocatellia bacterium]